MPFQYRRLAAHLQTNSADFNRRLQDYLTTHVAMRSALANSYGMNGQQMSSQQFNGAMMFPSPMLSHQQQQQQFSQSAMMQPPVSPTSTRQAPYPSPNSQQHSSHGRSNSIATPQEMSAQAHGQRPALKSERSHSVPTLAPITPGDSTSPPGSGDDRRRPSFPQGSFAGLGQSQTQSNAMFPSYNNTKLSPSAPAPATDAGHSSFSTALPAETQMFLGSTLNPHDPLTSLFMAGANSSHYYDFGANQLPQTYNLGKQQQYPTFEGLNSTLAPSNSQEASLDSGSSFFDQAVEASKNGNFGTSPAGTPGVNGEAWTNFIDTDQWDMPT